MNNLSCYFLRNFQFIKLSRITLHRKKGTFNNDLLKIQMFSQSFRRLSSHNEHISLEAKPNEEIQEKKKFLTVQNIPKDIHIFDKVNVYNKIRNKNNFESFIKLSDDQFVETFSNSILQQQLFLNGRNVLYLIKKIVYLSVNKKYYKELQQIKENGVLDRICIVLDKHLEVYSSNDLFSVFCFASKFKIPSDSLFMEKILSLLLSNVNKLSAENLLKFIYIVGKLNKDFPQKTAQALKRAGIHLLDGSSLSENISLKKASIYFSSNLFSQNINLKLLKIILEGAKKWDPYVFVNVVRGLRYLKEFEVLSNRAFDKVRSELAFNIDKKWYTFHLSDILYDLTFVGKRYNFYDEYLYDKIALLISETSCPFDITTKALCSLCSIPHFNASLYENFYENVKNMVSNYQPLTDEVFYRIFLILAGTNYFDFDEEMRDFWKTKIENFDYKTFLNQSKDFSPLDCFLNLLSLNIYKKELIDMVYDIILEDAYTGSYNAFKVLLFHGYISLFHPEDAKSLPHDLISKKIKITEKCFFLLQDPMSVYKLLGGTEYVLHGCITPEGTSLYSVFVLQSDNKPVDLSSYKQETTPINIKSINVPEGGKLVAIQNVKSHMASEFANVSLPVYWTRLTDRITEKLGYELIFLSENKVQNLSGLDITALIKEKLEKKFGEINVNL